MQLWDRKKTITSVSAAKNMECSGNAQQQLELKSNPASLIADSTLNEPRSQNTSDELNNPGKGSTCLLAHSAKNRSGFMSCFMYGQKADLLGMAPQCQSWKWHCPAARKRHARSAVRRQPTGATCPRDDVFVHHAEFLSQTQMKCFPETNHRRMSVLCMPGVC